MKRRPLLCFVAILWTVAAFAMPDGELARRLSTLEGVTEVQALPSGPFAEKYEVMLTQQLDPQDVAAGRFEQRIVVMHAGYDRPTVLITQGYDANFGLKEKYRDELSALFDTNIVLVEYRYFDRSMPNPCDWKYLTAENSAYDLHRVVMLFKEIYDGKWIASGISKGGTTTMLYAAYFPGDVDIYVPYVGPLCRSREDPRFRKFMKEVSTPESRAALQAFQLELFRRKERLMPAFQNFCTEKGYEFRLSAADIFDYCVLEYGIAFRQWAGKDSDILSTEVSDEALLSELIKRSDPGYFDRNSSLSSFFVQAARELGYYPYDLRPFRKYTSVRTTRDYMRRIFLPEELRHEQFSKKLYRKVTRYLKQNDPKMIMIYGGDDPWTAPGAGWAVTRHKHNMKLFVEPDGNHKTRIATLPEAMRHEAVETLKNWIEN